MTDEEYQMIYTCPQCGRSYPMTLYRSIDAKQRPDLKRKLLEGSLYEATCMNCGYISPLLYACIYIDPERHFMIHLAEDEAGMHVFEDMPLSSYHLRVVKDWNDMREKVVLFERGMDDRVVEIMKHIRMEQLQEKNPKLAIESIYYQPQDGGKFIVLGHDAALAAIRFDKGLYRAIYRQILPQIDPQLISCFLIDAAWARKAFIPGLSMLVKDTE